MAYGLRYYYEFDDNHVQHAATWKVNISFKDYEGDETEILHSTDSPLVITRGEQTDDKYTPIIGSECVMGIVITDESVISPKTFIDIDELECLVEVYKNNVIYWKGYVKQDFIQYPYDAVPYAFQIPATDRLSLIKSNLIDIQSEKEGDGYVSILSLLTSKGIKECKLGESLNIVSTLYYTDLPGVSYPGVGHPSIFTDRLYVRFEKLIDDSGNPINPYDSLKKLTKSFGARLFYSAGYFWFQRIEDLQHDLINARTYTEDGDFTASFQFSPKKLLKGDISSADGIYANHNTTIQVNAAHKQEKIDIDYIFRGYLLNHDWHAFSGGQFDNWDASDWSLITQGGTGSIQDPYYCQFRGNPSGTDFIYQVVDLNFQFPITINVNIDMSGCENTAWQLHTYLDTVFPLSMHHVYVNGEWINSNPTVPPGDHRYHNMIEKPDNNTGIYNLNVTVPNPPPQTNPSPPYATYDNKIQLMFIDPDGDGRIMKIFDVTLSQTVNGYTGEINTVRNTKNYSVLNDIDDSDFIDSYPNVANSLIYKAGSPGNEYYTNFNFGGKWKSRNGESKQIQQYNLEDRLNQNGGPYKKMTLDIYSNTMEFQNVIQQAFGDYDNYIIMYDEYDVKKCIHSVQMLQLKNTDYFTDGNFDFKHTYKPGSTIRTF